VPPGVRSASPKLGGTAEKWGHSKKIFTFNLHPAPLPSNVGDQCLLLIHNIVKASLHEPTRRAVASGRRVNSCSAAFKLSKVGNACCLMCTLLCVSGQSGRETRGEGYVWGRGRGLEGGADIVVY